MFISPDEWSIIRNSDSVDALNEVLERLHTKAVENALRSMPELISRLVKKSVAMERMSAAFYERNKEFLQHKPLVQETMLKVELENPTADYDELLRKTELEVKKKIASTANIDTFKFKE